MIRFFLNRYHWVCSLRYPRLFWLGWQEAHSGFGLTFDDDPTSPRSTAYDCGRNVRLWGQA